MDARQLQLVRAAPGVSAARVVVERTPRPGYGQPRQHVGTKPHIGPEVHAEHLAVPSDHAVLAAARQVAVVAAAPRRETSRPALFLLRRHQERRIAERLLQGQRLGARRGPPVGGRRER